MHDQDKNILKKYNIVCVIVTVKRLLLRFYIYEKMCGVLRRRFLKYELIRLLSFQERIRAGQLCFYQKAVNSTERDK